MYSIKTASFRNRYYFRTGTNQALLGSVFTYKTPNNNLLENNPNRSERLYTG